MPLVKPGRTAALLGLLAFPLFAVPLSAAAAGVESPAQVSRILHAAEGMFKAMKARDFSAVWASLTEASRRTIVDETHQAFITGGVGAVAPEALAEDFREGGIYARSYWNAFLTRFDPDAVLAESRWELDILSGRGGEHRAEIRITHRDSKRPAVLRMYLEEGAWKVGLVETFWGRPD